LAAIRKRLFWLLFIIIMVAVGGWIIWRAGRSTENKSNGSTAAVEKGPLTVSITEGGELEAERKKVISNALQWPVVIKVVVPEGTRVKQGEVIIRFECKALSDAITQQKLTVSAAKNKHMQANQNLILKKKEMDHKVRKAEQDLVNASEDKVRYIEGDWEVMLNDAIAEVQLTESDLKLAKDNLDFKLKVNSNPKLDSPYSKSEIDADKLKVARLALKHKKAVTELSMLKKYNHPREKRRLELAVDDAQIALDRAKLEAKTQMLLAQADEVSQKAQLDMKMDKLQDLLEDERKLVVKAEKEGLVVYNTGGSRRRPSNVIVDVGEQIRPRQQLMIIPDMTTLQVETRVYESMISQIKLGQKTYIRLDAKPDKVYEGKVSNIAVLPDSQNRWLNPGVKVYKVIVKFNALPEGLKPGMTSQAEIILARLADVLNVPIAAVFTQQDDTYCWRLKDGSPGKVSVKIGKTNDKRAQIISGLNEGDRVLLSPPASESESETDSQPSAIPMPGKRESKK